MGTLTFKREGVFLVLEHLNLQCVNIRKCLQDVNKSHKIGEM